MAIWESSSGCATWVLPPLAARQAPAGPDSSPTAFKWPDEGDRVSPRRGADRHGVAVRKGGLPAHGRAHTPSSLASPWFEMFRGMARVLEQGAVPPR
jgi:hypothetical protein